MLSRVADACRGRIWDLPRWVVSDGRHRESAEIGLLRALNVSGLPTYNVCTTASLAAEVLQIPLQSALVSPSGAALTLSEILAEDTPPSYQSSSQSPGFARSFWSALSDVETRGFWPEENLPNAVPPAPPEAFADLQRRLHRKLGSRGRFTPPEFLRRARQELLNPTFKFDIPLPLFIGPLADLNVPEKAFLWELLNRVDQACIAVAPGSSAEQWVLSLIAESEQPRSDPLHSLSAALICPRTPETELDDVFRIIARLVAEKKFRYRDFRLIHPFVEDSWPRLRSAARRYRVPVKGRISRNLSDFPGAAALLMLLDLFESGWDREHVLGMLRSGLVGDLASRSRSGWIEKPRLIRGILNPDAKNGRLVRGRDWPGLAREVGASGILELFQSLSELDDLKRQVRDGPSFASWIRQIIHFIRKGRPESLDPGYETRQIQAEEEAGWEALDSLLTDFVPCFPRKASRSSMTAELKKSMGLVQFVPVDRRLDAVEICPGGREDFLPVPAVIYLSLDSRVPSPERLNPFLENETTIKYPEQERRFHQQAANARQLLILSCPRFDDDGDEVALSPFLSSIFISLSADSELNATQTWQPFKAWSGNGSLSTSDPKTADSARIIRPSSLDYLRHRNRRWSSTQLENAIQCPYLHFAADVLKVEPLSDTLREGVTPLIAGSVAHRILEEYLKAVQSRAPYDLEQRTRTEFDERTRHLEPHPETDRMGVELVRCLLDFVRQGWHQLADGFDAHRYLEEPFGRGSAQPTMRFDVEDQVIHLEGKIDRLDESADGRVLVIEYKYKKAERESKSEFFEEIETGLQPQLPLYWMVVREAMGKTPAALLQIYLRSGVIRGLRLSGQADLLIDIHRDSEIKAVTIEEFEEILKRTREMLFEKAMGVTSGRIHPNPRDFQRCGPGNCDYADLCRFRKKWM